MVKGQKVICINDTFSPTIRALYKQLPVKDNIYTVREVFLGREKIVKGGDSATVGLLLEEITNPRDPFHQGEQELGFSSERFAPLNELPDEQVEVEDVVGVGAWAPVCGLSGARASRPQFTRCGRDARAPRATPSVNRTLPSPSPDRGPCSSRRGVAGAGQVS